MAGDNLARKLEPESDDKPKIRHQGNVVYGLPFGSRNRGRNQTSQPGIIIPFKQRDDEVTAQQRRENTIAQLRQDEQQNFNKSDPDDIKNSEAQSDAGWKTNVNSNKGAKTSKSAKGLIARNKGKFVGVLIGVVMGGGLLMGGVIVSGPAQIIAAAGLIGQVADTVFDYVSQSRMARNIARSATSTFTQNAQNKRVSNTGRLVARSFEKTLARNGITINSTTSGQFASFDVDSRSLSNFDVEEIRRLGGSVDEIGDAGSGLFRIRAPDGASGRQASQFFRRTMSYLNSNVMHGTFFSKSKVFSSLATRALGKMNLMVGFHPIKKLTAKIVDVATTIGKAAKNALLGTYIAKKATQIADGLRTAGRASRIVARLSKAVDVAKTVAQVGGGIIRGISTGLKSTVIGAIVGIALDALVSFVIKRIFNVDPQINLNIASGKAMEIQSTSDQIKADYFPEQENGEVSVMEELELFTMANLSRTIDVDNEDRAAAADQNCSDIEDEDEQDACIQDALDAGRDSMTSGSYTEVESSFWKSAAVRSEMGYDYNAEDGSVPIELLKVQNYDAEAEVLEDIAFSVMEAVVFVSPDDFTDSDGVLDAEAAYPDQIGSISMFGATNNEKTRMAAAGGETLNEQETAEVNATRQAILDTEYEQKSWFAKLFDPTDHRSGLNTLARTAEWDTSSQSIATQLKNVAKTVAMVPTLLASTIKQFSYASADTTPFDYGIPATGFSDDQLDDLPDYDTASNWVMNNYSSIGQDNLKKYAGVRIRDDATNTVEYLEDTEGVFIDKKEAQPDFASNVGCTDSDVGESWRGQCGDAMVRAYLLDYMVMSPAAVGAYDDTIGDTDMSDAEKDDLYNELVTVAKDMGIETVHSSTNGASGPGNSPFATADEAKEAMGRDTNYTYSYDGYTLALNGCTAVPRWFIGQYTTLNASGGNGWAVAKNLVAANSSANPSIAISSTPRAPAIFSTSTYGTSYVNCGAGGDPNGNNTCGHTGLVVAVNGNTAYTFECGLGISTCWGGEIDLTEYDGLIDYVYVGDHLK